MNPPPVRYLVLWLTTACNLRCRYCYRKSDLPAVMTRDVVQAALSLAAAAGRSFHVQLAGGEPTLEPGLIEFVGRTVREARWPATLAVQTNGTLVDRHLVELCRRYDVGIGVSLDGPPDVQEELRGMGGASFRGLALLEALGMPVRVTTVLSSVNVERLYDLALSLARFTNIRGIGLDPLVMTGRAEGEPHLHPSAEALRSGVGELLKALEYMKYTYSVPIIWREREAVRRALSEKGSARPYCHACCGESMAVHPDGRVYPCGQAIGDPDMAAGTVDAVDWTRLRTCYQGFELNGDCSSCPLEGRCPGECPSRLRYNNGVVPPAMCTVYRTIAENLTVKCAERSMPWAG